MIKLAVNRVGINALVSYSRSLVSLALGLFSARWLLAALGESDFGVFTVVGSVMAFAVFFGELLRVSTARHFAVALGSGGREEVGRWLCASLRMHLIAATVITILTLTIGILVVRYLLVIPEGRMGAATVVLSLSSIVLFCSTITIPWDSLFVACQRFITPAILGAAKSFWFFICAYWLLRAEGDRLIYYAVYSAVGHVSACMLTVLFATRMFHGSFGAWPLDRKKDVDGDKVRQVLSFAGWTAFGGGGMLVAMHGSAMVTNRFFGTVGNASYGIASQIQSHVEALSNSLLGAFSPAINESAGSGVTDRTRGMAQKAGFLGSLLLAFFTVPLMLEFGTVVDVWLVDPPQHATLVCSMLLVGSVLNKLTMGQQMAIAADGRIVGMQIAGGISLLLVLPLTALFAHGEGGVESAATAYLCAVLGCVCGNVYFGRRVAGITVREWIVGTVLPFAAIVSLAVLFGMIPRCFLPAGLPRVVVTSMFTSVVFGSGVLIWKQST